MTHLVVNGYRVNITDAPQEFNPDTGKPYTPAEERAKNLADALQRAGHTVEGPFAHE